MLYSKQIGFIFAILLQGWICQSMLYDKPLRKVKAEIDGEASSMGGIQDGLSETDPRKSGCDSGMVSVELLDKDHLGVNVKQSTKENPIACITSHHSELSEPKLDAEASSMGEIQHELSVLYPRKMDCDSEMSSVEILENSHLGVNVEHLPKEIPVYWIEGTHSNLSESDSKQRDWDLMINSVNQLEKDYQVCNVEAFQPKYPRVIMETITELRSLHEQMGQLFGPEWEVRLSRNQLQDYRNSVWRILKILRRVLNYPKPIHHLRVAGNNCILETFNFIRRYNLAEDHVLINLQRAFSSKKGLMWLIRAIDGVFRTNTELWNEFHSHPTGEEQMRYDLHMKHIYNTYKSLEKKQQDFLLFNLAINRYGIEESDECRHDGPITKPLSKPLIEHIHFMRKVRKFIKEELENESPRKATRKEFFLEVKDELMEMRKFYFDPHLPPGYNQEEFTDVFRYRAAALRFIHERIGSDYMNEPEFQVYNEDTADFEPRFQLPFILQKHTEMKNIMLYYSHYASKFMTRGKSHEVPKNVRKTIGMVLWKKIIENLDAYEILKIEQGERLEEYSKNIMYRHIMEDLDKFSEDLPRLKQESESLFLDPEEKSSFE
ncbi:hypothetical protein PTTG_12453 [Puccinia triticina 1-1 BBBD Race 1]|uniref:Uncharacterized protein n=1 Tax=Puccinia triticina (isolate 1-1 / race 1 (BBBD)) TaxID=630390 RepID=A0A180GRR6_PUCT1|nr:hypothetical protein PTTG_12453 [Puccinia triticina 1-1 BBBD Race 1]